MRPPVHRVIANDADASAGRVVLAPYGVLTMGECWHNNHHAFPESARIGLLRGESDPGWWIIHTLHKIGWVTRVGLPRGAVECEDFAYAD
jgi:fatty-acid desaturase